MGIEPSDSGLGVESSTTVPPWHVLYLMVHTNPYPDHCLIIASLFKRMFRHFFGDILSTANLSSGHFVIWSFCQLFILSTVHFVNCSFCQLFILSTDHFVNWSFCQLVILSTGHSTGHFVNCSFCQLFILSTGHF